jgi:hypothetical protein
MSKYPTEKFRWAQTVLAMIATDSDTGCHLTDEARSFPHYVLHELCHFGTRMLQIKSPFRSVLDILLYYGLETENTVLQVERINIYCDVF